MRGVRPDTTGLEAIHSQPEFNESSGNISTAASPTGASLPAGRRRRNTRRCSPASKRISASSALSCSAFGASSPTFGDPVVEKNHMRPVIPSLATLAWGEPRRRAYWESELINALAIIQRGWSTPEEMVGSWAGAMGHTQWMPEVWLHVGKDYNGDGKISPFGPPDDALGSTARYFVERGKYRRGEHWGYEVRMPAPDQAATFHAATPPGRRAASSAPTARPSRSRMRRRDHGCRCRAVRRSCSAPISSRCEAIIRR